MPKVFNLEESRESLLREYIASRGAAKAVVLAKILEVEAEIEEEKNRRRLLRAFA